LDTPRKGCKIPKPDLHKLYRDITRPLHKNSQVSNKKNLKTKKLKKPKNLKKHTKKRRKKTQEWPHVHQSRRLGSFFGTKIGIENNLTVTKKLGQRKELNSPEKQLQAH
jgi:hypothetical protein